MTVSPQGTRFHRFSVVLAVWHLALRLILYEARRAVFVAMMRSRYGPPRGGRRYLSIARHRKIQTYVTHFSELGLAPALLKALAAEGYENPTPIQAKAIPPVLAGRDVVGTAQTGTGKTAAFALPILQRLADAPKPTQPFGVRALILSPTRELASQIEQSFRSYGRFLRLSTMVVFGGVPIGRQRNVLTRGVDILVATPGRLLDLVDQRALRLDQVEILVLDEADQMMDLGFIHALRRIAKLVPKDRQSLFFSATMPPAIRELAAQFLSNPAEVSVAPVSSTAERVEQQVVHTSPALKPVLLAQLLSNPDFNRVIVFSRTKHGADRVVRGLEANGITAAAIHGNKSQPHRERALKGFRDGTCKVLVATDIAARGIDVDGVSHVINFDLPNVPETYVHRIGRTARAGATGLAISFCIGEERPYLCSIERLTRSTIPVVDMQPDPDRAYVAPKAAPREIDPRAIQNRQQRGGNRNSNGGGEQRRDDRPRHWHGQKNGQGANSSGESRTSHGGDNARPSHSRDSARPQQRQWTSRRP